MKEIYLDNSQTTRPSEKVVSEMLPFFGERWGSLSAPHRRSQSLLQPVKKAYDALYKLVDANGDDLVIFTSSGAEAINQVVLSAYLEVMLPSGKNQFLTSTVEEAPTMMAISRLEKMGAVAKFVKPNEGGIVTADCIADALTPRTALISLSWANGLTGVIQPVEEIATLCQERGVLFHLDATHVLGKLYFERDNVGADFITFNGDHLHAPAGTGALYIKKGTAIAPLIAGGLEQGGQRAGSFSVASLVGLGEAARLAEDAKELLCTEVARLRSLLEDRVVAGFPEAKVLFQKSRRLPHITAIAFPGVVNEALLFLLSRKNLFASMGGGSFQQIALNVEGCLGEGSKLAKTALSFSLSRETTEGDIELAAEIIVKGAKLLAVGSRRVFDGH